VTDTERSTASQFCADSIKLRVILLDASLHFLAGLLYTAENGVTAYLQSCCVDLFLGGVVRASLV
jgi:hypothetical protein